MFFTDFEEVEHLCTSAVTAIGSLQKQIRTPRRVLFKSGPLMSISLREIPLCLTLELNTTLISGQVFVDGKPQILVDTTFPHLLLMAVLALHVFHPTLFA